MFEKIYKNIVIEKHDTNFGHTDIIWQGDIKLTSKKIRLDIETSIKQSETGVDGIFDVELLNKAVTLYNKLS